jgi:LacI family transcriptional regulator
VGGQGDDDRPAPARNPTVRDVAKAAGVSQGTVSNVLNRPDIVSPDTRDRVHAAIEALGFVRNGAARSLVTGGASTIGLVLVDIANSLFVDIARGVDEGGRAHGMSVLLANSDVQGTRQDHYLSLFDETWVCGILLAPLDAPLHAAQRIHAHGRPVVLVNYAADGFCGVLVDEEQGGYLAARHLIDRGRRRLAFVGGPLDLRAVDGRLRGARRAVKETGGAVRLVHLPTANLKPAEGRRVATEVARGDHGPLDGLLTAADTLATAAIQELTTVHGLRVPDDIAVTGYDDNHFASDNPIPVTTLRQPGREMGRIATGLLVEEIRDPRDHEHRTVVLEPELIPRQSTVG